MFWHVFSMPVSYVYMDGRVSVNKNVQQIIYFSCISEHSQLSNQSLKLQLRETLYKSCESLQQFPNEGALVSMLVVGLSSIVTRGTWNHDWNVLLRGLSKGS